MKNPIFIRPALLMVFFLLVVQSCIKPEVTIEGEYVDLRPQQTPLKNQGSRTSCIVFSVVAALEAEYKKRGFGEADLSEEFLNYALKAFYLHPVWNDYLTGIPDRVETQLGSTGGGGGLGVLDQLTRGFKIPNESVMPYVSSENYYESRYPILNTIVELGSSATQKDYSNFNLKPEILTHEILQGDHTWFDIRSFEKLESAQNPDEIETVLRQRKEVVWDFNGVWPYEGATDVNGTWQTCPTCTPTVPHSMLIVGFDKRDADPSKHYFIVKNSWGINYTDNRMAGYTSISYDYLRSYGYSAGYISAVDAIKVNDSYDWPEVAFIGRWKTHIQEIRGILDIYHLPGMADPIFEDAYQRRLNSRIYEDNRIGTFYDENGNYYRVNGSIEKNHIQFYIDYSKSLVRWDEIRGTEYSFYMDKNDFMAGFYDDSQILGRKSSGYATKINYLTGPENPQNLEIIKSFLDRDWTFKNENWEGHIDFKNISYNHADFKHIDGTLISTLNGYEYDVRIKVPINGESNEYYLQISRVGTSVSRSFKGIFLPSSKTIMVGFSAGVADRPIPFSMIREN